MRISILATMGLALWTNALSAQDAIDPKTLIALKRATVFVKVKGDGRDFSGSGFVVKVDKESALVVTNHHVIEPKIEVDMLFPGPRGPIPGRPIGPPGLLPHTMVTTIRNASVSVIFDSGTKAERSVKAEILAVDPQRDLALLRVTKVADLPAPIEFNKAPELIETLPVYTFGFPFGKVLAVGKDNPAITVGKAAISSLRDDVDGDLAYVQIDGALNPGNSGGPIVDVKGQLVGVAVATIRNSTGIGLAIPGAELRKMFAGRLGVHHATAKPGADGNTDVTIEVAVIDPMSKCQTVTLHYLAGSKVPDVKKKFEALDTLPGAKKIELNLEKHLAIGEFTLETAVKEKDVLLQSAWVDEAGNVIKSKVIRQPFTTSIAKNIVREKKDKPAPMDIGDKRSYTKIVGFSLASNFKDDAPDGAYLIGFELGLGLTGRKDVVRSLRPIYRSAKGDLVLGEQWGTLLDQVVTVKAKDGYAIAGLNVSSALYIEGIQLNFRRVKDGKLDGNDAYQSEWIGTRGNRVEAIEGINRPIPGIVGKRDGYDVKGIGLRLWN
jgi:hypothetical protein